MTGAKMVVQALKDQGVEVVFGYPGGAVLPIYDEIFQQNDIRHILVRHEQGAVHAAEGYARSTGKPGVVLVTSGPGATNAVTGITDALMDSIPLVVLTGQVPTFMIGTDAFQEADTVGITRPCTKHNWLVKDTDKLAEHHPPGLPRRHHRPPRPGAGGHPQGRAVRHRHLYTAPQKAAPTITSPASRATSPRSPRWSS
jgi:thiamine pyrophosphate-dependent acetolactate synthase large subunit-like protein